MFFENKGVVYELDEKTKTGKVKYSDCMIQEAKIADEINGCIINEIASKAFYHDEKLKSVTIPDTVVKIKNSSFEGCKKLTTINDNKILNVENIGYFAFKGSGIKKLNLPKIKTIGKGAMLDCLNLLLLILPNDSITVLEEDTIANCPSLQEFTFPASLISVKSNFIDCDNMKRMIFMNSNLDVMKFIQNISKDVILFGEQGSQVQRMALYGYNFMLKSFMK